MPRTSSFSGIPYGNLGGYSLVNQVANPAFIEGIKLMQQPDPALDTANPHPDLIGAVLRLTDTVPNLRVIIDHLPSLTARRDAKTSTAVEADLVELAHRPQVYVKLSQLLRMAESTSITDSSVYKPILDRLFDMFAEEHPIFGSDWPNSSAVDYCQNRQELLRRERPKRRRKVLLEEFGGRVQMGQVRCRPAGDRLIYPIHCGLRDVPSAWVVVLNVSYRPDKAASRVRAKSAESSSRVKGWNV